MHLCILDHAGNVVYDKNLPTSPDAFLHAVAPCSDDLVVGVECEPLSGGPAFQAGSFTSPPDHRAG
jgi:hypothetical protein